MGRAFSQMRQLANQCSSRLLETKEIHSVSLSPTQKEDMKFFKGRWVRGGGTPLLGHTKNFSLGVCVCVGVKGAVLLTLSKGLLPSRAEALRDWLPWLRLMGVGALRGALSFRGAWIAEGEEHEDEDHYLRL